MLPIQRSMTEFTRGAWQAERTTLASAARKTASNAALKLERLTDLWVLIIGAALLGSYFTGLAMH
jgi:hypothetical protein